MDGYNNHRKCAKCGKTRSEDMSVTYHRFPRPGITNKTENVTKARAWATYCWPDKDWSSVDSLMSLHTQNKVLCGRHFQSSQFYDSERRKLSKFAVPESSEVDELLTARENVFDQSAPTQVSTPNSTASDQALSSHIMAKKNRGILQPLSITKLSEMTLRDVKLYNLCKKRLRGIMRLRNELKKRKINRVRKILENEDVQKLCSLNLSNSFAVFLQSQMRNCPRKPKKLRYTQQQKLMALVIYKRSPACYRLLRRFFALPGQGCLNELLNCVPLQPGINKHLFESLRKMAQNQTREENVGVLLFDEMSIRKHIHYNCKLDQIQGFQDLGNHGRSKEIATKALVFMLSGLKKNWKQPVAFYCSHALTAARMTVILKEILIECFNSGINVVATVCDLSTVNLKVLETLGATSREPYFSLAGREIVAILDPPDLLKCTRNLLIKHDVECTDLQCSGQIVKGTVKWSHFEKFYELDKNNPNFVYAPALTDQHIHPNAKQQMRLTLAAQVLSHSVAAGLFSKIANNKLQTEAFATARFAAKFDQLFDAVNADSPDLRRGKLHSTNITARSPHIALFNEMRRYISSMKYLGSETVPPSQEGWIHTMNAIQRLWNNRKKLNIKSLSTRRLNLDPLGNCFSCIRYNCGSTYKPTIQQFVEGMKTAIITNLQHSD